MRSWRGGYAGTRVVPVTGEGGVRPCREGAGLRQVDRFFGPLAAIAPLEHTHEPTLAAHVGNLDCKSTEQEEEEATPVRQPMRSDEEVRLSSFLSNTQAPHGGPAPGS